MTQQIHKYYWVLILMSLSFNPSWTLASEALVIELKANPYHVATKLSGGVIHQEEIKQEFTREIPAFTPTTISLNEVPINSRIVMTLIHNANTTDLESDRTLIANGNFTVSKPLASLEISFKNTKIRFHPTYPLPAESQDDTL